MIAMSDAVLILVSASVLGSGLYRWQNNLNPVQRISNVPAATVQAQIPATPQVQSQQVQIPQVQNTQLSTNNSTAASSTVIDIPPTQTIDVADNASSAAVDVSDNINTSANSDTPALADLVGSHIVASGDTLSELAARYNTSVSFLQNINQLDSTVINVGQKLLYPLPVN